MSLLQSRKVEETCRVSLGRVEGTARFLLKESLIYLIIDNSIGGYR